jgi:hypothetical protein
MLYKGNSMTYLFIILLAGINLAPMLFNKLDMWHAQGIYFQSVLLIMFCASFIIKPNEVKVKNIPMALFMLWAGLWTLFISYNVMQIQKYLFGSLLPFLNILWMVLFYKLCVQYLNKDRITKIVNILSYCFIGTIIYSFLQGLGIDQFTKTVVGHEQINLATGFIGNPVHYSALIACLSPLLFIRKLTVTMYGLIICILTMLFMCSTEDIALPVTGLITISIVIMYLIYKIDKRIFYMLSFLIGCLLISLYILDKTLFTVGSRFEVIKQNFLLVKDSLITGKGLGFINVSAKADMIKMGLNFPFHHLHNEYLQVMFELGIVGFLTVVYGLWDYWVLKVQQCKIVWILRAMFLGFMVQSLTLFPAHLWLCSSMMMFSYAALYAIKNEETCKLSAN